MNLYASGFISKNLLVSMTGTSLNAGFVYNGDGERVKGTVNGVATTYVGNYYEWTGSTSTMVKYYFAGTQRVAMRTGTAAPKWILSDHLGSTSVVTDYYGANPVYQRYKPFGETRLTNPLGTKYTFTGQLSHTDDFGLLFFNARWVDPQLARFAQADTIVPDAYNAQDYDRYAYTRNNPLRYVDPSGHNPECGPDGIFCSNSFEERFSITLKGDDWTSRDRAAVRAAIRAVAGKFSDILEISSEMAFYAVYGHITMEMGNCTLCASGSEVAGYTYSANEIRFAGLSNRTHERRVNHVIHELGHAFKWTLFNRKGIDVYAELSNWRNTHPGYPDRETYSGPEAGIGPNYGFASPQNVYTWQQNPSGDDSEEFADQFLGWTFERWESDRYGFLTPDGQARSDMMKTNMPLWVNLAAGK